MQITSIICSIMVLTALLFLFEYFLRDNSRNEARRGRRFSQLWCCVCVLLLSTTHVYR